MKQIELSKGLFTLVDEEDYIFLNQVKWSASFNQKGKNWVALNKKHGLLHRYLLNINSPDLLVKHKNGNTLDNRRENLEVIDRCISKQRAKKFKANNKYRGVVLDKTVTRVKKWRVTINNKHVGMFATEKEAALAWNKAALVIHGENAQLNVIE